MEPERIRRVRIHLDAQATVDFSADQLWPRHGEYARFGPDLAALAEEVSRRLRMEGYVGYSPADDHITLMPLSAIKRIDFTEE
jgi:hypothetical protein